MRMSLMSKRLMSSERLILVRLMRHRLKVRRVLRAKWMLVGRLTKSRRINALLWTCDMSVGCRQKPSA